MSKDRLKNIIRGMRSVMDICPNTDHYRNITGNASRTDAEALRQDWNKVGRDLRHAIDSSGYEKK